MKYLKPLALYHESLKTTGPLIGLSVSKKLLGLSFSDASKSFVLPPMSKTLSRTENPVSALQDLISSYSVSGLVIGYPFRIEEIEKIEKSSSTAGVQAKCFLDDLNKSNFEDMNYTLWDESHTTKMLFHSIKEISKPFRFTPMDHQTITVEHAAYEILQEYFHTIINNSEDDRYFHLINRDNPF